jgi:hypothetical protein
MLFGLVVWLLTGEAIRTTEDAANISDAMEMFCILFIEEANCCVVVGGSIGEHWLIVSKCSKDEEANAALALEDVVVPVIYDHWPIDGGLVIPETPTRID